MLVLKGIIELKCQGCKHLEKLIRELAPGLEITKLPRYGQCFENHNKAYLDTFWLPPRSSPPREEQNTIDFLHILPFNYNTKLWLEIASKSPPPVLRR